MVEIGESILKLFSTRDLPLSSFGQCYTVRRRPDGRNCATYNFYPRRIQAFSELGFRHVIIVLDAESSHEKVFVIPLELLVDQVFPGRLKPDGKYKFQIHRGDLVLTWQGSGRAESLKMQGSFFLVSDNARGVAPR